MDIIKTEIDLEEELPNVSSTQWFLKYSFNKELRIILGRCDSKENFNKPFQVDNCKKSFDFQSNLKQHISRVHESVPIKCPRENCGKYVKSFYMNVHIRKQHESQKHQKYHCPVEGCEKFFFTKTGLIKHQKFTHENFKSTCKNCGKEVLHLKYHLWRCLNNIEKKIFCSVQNCKSFFLSRAHLKRREKIVHEKFKYTCSNCGKKVGWLSKHLNRCLSDGDRKFHCVVENCSSSFTTKSNLNDHVNSVHTNPVKCSHKGCNTFLKPCAMKRHVNYYHCRSDSYQCKNCGKRCINMSRHRVFCMNDGVKKISCQVANCTAKFSTELHLKAHVKSPHAVPIKCPHKNCDKMMKPNSLVSHLKHVHEGIFKTRKSHSKLVRQLKAHKKICDVVVNMITLENDQVLNNDVAFFEY